MFIDQNSITCFIDQNSITCFIDQNGIKLCCLVPGFNKFNTFVVDLANKIHNLGADALKVALSDVAPVATNAVLADITQIATGTGYPSGGLTSNAVSSSQVAGVYTLIRGNVAVTANGGSIGPFRYLVLYNSTPTSPLKPLISWYDYGSEINLSAGETFVAAFDPLNGVLQLI